MATFKIKNESKKRSLQISTLDDTHRKIMGSFKSKKDLLPKKKRRVDILTLELATLESQTGSNYKNEHIKRRSELKTEIGMLQGEIHDIENDISELDYYYKASDIIMDYYDQMEKDDVILYINNPELSDKQNDDSDTQTATLTVTMDKLDKLNQMNKKQVKYKKTNKRNKKIVVNRNNVNILDYLNAPVANSLLPQSPTQSLTQSQISNNCISDTSESQSCQSQSCQSQSCQSQSCQSQSCQSQSCQSQSCQSSNANCIDILRAQSRSTFIEPSQQSPTNTAMLSDPEIGKSYRQPHNHETAIATNLNLTIKQNKSEMLNKYMVLINNVTPGNKKQHIVKKCKRCNIEKILIPMEGNYVCTICGDVDPVIIECEKSTNKDINAELKSGYPYKRINHLNEWLAQFQAKESIEIPEDVYNLILSEFHKHRIYDLKKISIPYMKKVLKKLGLTVYYEHATFIISKLSGTPPPSINRETEEKIRLMFKQIQMPFERHCPPNRTNFLSYSYVLHKFFQLLELDDFSDLFQLLKSDDKLRSQDEIWKKICEDLNWQFIPSI